MKKIKIIIDGKEIEAKLPDVVIRQLTKNKRTGYEIVEKGKPYYFVDKYGGASSFLSDGGDVDEELYQVANYFSDEGLAKDRARALALHDRLERFAAEHKKKEFDWNNPDQKKYLIYFDYDSRAVCLTWHYVHKTYGQIYFDTEKTARLAFGTFRDELIWYFTEYKDSL